MGRDLRFKHNRLGCLGGQHLSSGSAGVGDLKDLGSPDKKATHHIERDQSCCDSTLEVLTTQRPAELLYPPEIGQSNCRVLFQPQSWKEDAFEQEHDAILDNSGPTQDPPQGDLLARENQHSRRRSVQTLQGSVRMAPEVISLPYDTPASPSHSRFICQQGCSSSPTILLQTSRSEQSRQCLGQSTSLSATTRTSVGTPSVLAHNGVLDAVSTSPQGSVHSDIPLVAERPVLASNSAPSPTIISIAEGLPDSSRITTPEVAQVTKSGDLETPLWNYLHSRYPASVARKLAGSVEHATSLEGFSTCKTFISALKLAFVDIPKDTDRVLTRLVAANKKLNPPTPKYSRMFDCRVVLQHLARLEISSFVTLRNKLLMLIALDKAQQASGLATIYSSQCRKEGSYLWVRVHKPKEGSDGLFGPWTKISATSAELADICTVRTFDLYIQQYESLNVTRDLVGPPLFVSGKGKGLKTELIKSVLHNLLKSAGISPAFKAHSTRGASLSMVGFCGMSPEDDHEHFHISAGTAEKHYRRLLVAPEDPLRELPTPACYSDFLRRRFYLDQEYSDEGQVLDDGDNSSTTDED